LLDWRLARIGPLNIFPAIMATIVGLIAASILAGPESPPRKRRK
jgi:hypothetical protein